MKLRQDDNIVISNTQNEKRFTIAATAKAFKILSDSLYSRKIEAIVRELSCNAYDSHVQAGHPERPFEITLPSIWTPEFSVEDFGVGLDNTDVESIYTSYFTSTKTESNDVIGALGLGSKTPFSYTDTFNITTRKNGKQYVYNAFINSFGEPSVSLLSETETVEPNGVKITVPVRESDFYQFKSDVVKVAKWFAIKPIVNNYDGEIDNSRAIKLKEEGAFWIARGREGVYTSNRVVAVIGNVAYEVDSVTDTFKNELSGGEKTFLEQNTTFVSFNIGDLDVAASRETISFDEVTSEVFVKRIKDVIYSYAKEHQDALDQMAIENKGPLAAIEYIDKNVGLWANMIFEYCGQTVHYWETLNIMPELERIFFFGNEGKKRSALYSDDYYSRGASWSASIRKRGIAYTHINFKGMRESKIFFLDGCNHASGMQAVARDLIDVKKAYVFMIHVKLTENQRRALTETFGVDYVEFVDFETANRERKEKAAAERKAKRLEYLASLPIDATTGVPIVPVKEKKEKIKRTLIRAAVIEIDVDPVTCAISYTRIDDKGQFDIEKLNEIDLSKTVKASILRGKVDEEINVYFDDENDELHAIAICCAVNSKRHMIIYNPDQRVRNEKLLESYNIEDFNQKFETKDQNLLVKLFVACSRDENYQSDTQKFVDELIFDHMSENEKLFHKSIITLKRDIKFYDMFKYNWKVRSEREVSEYIVRKFNHKVKQIHDNVISAKYPLFEKISNNYHFELDDLKHYIECVDSLKEKLENSQNNDVKYDEVA